MTTAQFDVTQVDPLCTDEFPIEILGMQKRLKRLEVVSHSDQALPQVVGAVMVGGHLLAYL